jgi:DNA replication protein DnaC
MDEVRVSEPVQAGGLFGKVMADISRRASAYRAQGSIGTPRNESRNDLPLERVSELHGCPPKKWAKTFEAFDLALAPQMIVALGASCNIAAGTWEPWCLLLSGDYGTGKTHLAYAAANYRREHGLPYRMLTAPALMSQLKNSIDEKRLSIEHKAPVAYGPEDWVRVYSETPALLIIDDFGAQQDTDWATAQLFSILNARYDAELPTLITTNLGAGNLDPRIASRCRAGIVVCKGPDQRANGR